MKCEGEQRFLSRLDVHQSAKLIVRHDLLQAELEVGEERFEGGVGHVETLSERV